MTTAIICLLLVIAAVFAVRGYAKRMTTGCCGSGGDPPEKKIRVTDTKEEHYPYVSIIQIPDMTCKNCVRKIENAFNCVEGIWAKISLKRQEAIVRYKEPMLEDKLKEIVEKAGYTVKEISCLDAKDGKK